VEGIPLTREDRAILALEEGPVLGHTCKVIVVEPPVIGMDELGAAVAPRLAAAPELMRKLDGDEHRPSWVPADDFDIRRHVGAADIEEPLSSEGLRREVARLFAERLDRDRPLWRMDLVPLESDWTALVWRIHHALADGTACMRLATAVLLDLESPEAPAHHAAPGGEERARRQPLRALEHEVGFVEREFGGSLRPSPFDAKISSRREVSFASVELEPLRRAAKELAAATVNDAVLTVVAGGIRRWLEHHHGSLGSVRVKVPVSLHHEGDGAANRDSFFSVAVPIGDPDAVSRLRAVRAATAKRKRAHDAEAMDSLLRELARVSPRLERFCERIETSPRRFALTISNVRGPSCAASLLGRRVDRIHSLAEIRLRHALRVATLSFSGRLWFGFCADPDVVEGVEEMAAGVEAEAAELAASA
jgi:Wax ester synthase/diacylglycerol acyltransferase catalytic domain/WS/DGAT C-terminal domain